MTKFDMHEMLICVVIHVKFDMETLACQHWSVHVKKAYRLLTFKLEQDARHFMCFERGGVAEAKQIASSRVKF